MDSDVLAFAQVMAILIPSVAALAGIGLGSFALVTRMVRRKSQPRAVADDSRIERIENAIDAIAIEVERISEGQRFTVSLLSERLPARGADRVGGLPQPVSDKRINTPH